MIERTMKHGGGKERPWPNWATESLNGLCETTTRLSQQSQSPDQELKPGTPKTQLEYKKLPIKAMSYAITKERIERVLFR
jgi:hypothetical protein